MDGRLSEYFKILSRLLYRNKYFGGIFELELSVDISVKKNNEKNI